MGCLHKLSALLSDRVDQAKVGVYYRDIPSREVAPSEWDEQIVFWQSLLFDWIRENDIVYFYYKDIIDSLTYEGLEPPIDKILKKAVKERTLALETEENRSKSILGRIKKRLEDVICRGDPEIGDHSLFVVPAFKKRFLFRMQTDVHSKALSYLDTHVLDSNIQSMIGENPFVPVAKALIDTRNVYRIGSLGFCFESERFPRLPEEMSLEILKSLHFLEQLKKEKQTDVVTEAILQIENEISRISRDSDIRQLISVLERSKTSIKEANKQAEQARYEKNAPKTNMTCPPPKRSLYSSRNAPKMPPSSSLGVL